jgi:hypothetical protein
LNDVGLHHFFSFVMVLVVCYKAESINFTHYDNRMQEKK